MNCIARGLVTELVQGPASLSIQSPSIIQRSRLPWMSIAEKPMDG